MNKLLFRVLIYLVMFISLLFIRHYANNEIAILVALSLLYSSLVFKSEKE